MSLLRRRMLLAASRTGESLFPAILTPSIAENLSNYSIALYFYTTYPDMVIADINGYGPITYTPITEDVTIEGSYNCNGKVIGVARFPIMSSIMLLFFTEKSIKNSLGFRVVVQHELLAQGLTLEVQLGA